MTNATQSQITEITEQISKVEQDAGNQVASLYAKIRDIANERSGDFHMDNGSPTAAKTTSKPSKPATETPKKNGKSGRKPRAEGGKLSLTAAITKILGTPSMWKEHVGDDLERGQTGLSAGQVKKVVIGSEIWSSDSKNFGGQVHTALNKLFKKEKTIVRDGRLYSLKK